MLNYFQGGWSGLAPEMVGVSMASQDQDHRSEMGWKRYGEGYEKGIASRHGITVAVCDRLLRALATIG